jgi:hypothetical protein
VTCPRHRDCHRRGDLALAITPSIGTISGFQGFTISSEEAVSKIISRFQSDFESRWGEGAQPRLEFLGKILDRYEVGTATHLTLGMLKQVDNRFTNEEILEFLEFLCSNAINLFEPKFEVFDSAGEIHALTIDQFATALETDNLVLNRTGEQIDDFREQVRMFYSATEKLDELFKEREL